MYEAEVCSYENDQSALHNLLEPFSSNEKNYLLNTGVIAFLCKSKISKLFIVFLILSSMTGNILSRLNFIPELILKLWLKRRYKLRKYIKDSISDTICLWGNQTYLHVQVYDEFLLLLSYTNWHVIFCKLLKYSYICTAIN